MEVEKFSLKGSPLDGQVVPMDWAYLTFQGRCNALVRVGYARNFKAAARLLGKHGAAVRRQQKQREEAAKKMWWKK